MASSELISEPRLGVVSAHEPIKYTYRIKQDTNNIYKSAVFIITPRNTYTNAFDYTRQVRIRVQPSLYIPNIYKSSGGNSTDNHDFSLDISSILRDFMSYDLRPCNHDTSNGIVRDITQSMPSTNMFVKYSITIQAEKIDANGALNVDGNLDVIRDTNMAANVALSDEEINSLTLANTLLTGSSSNFQNSALDKAFTHSFTSSSTGNDNNFGTGKTGRAKYLTLKPNHRVIGVDESEYISIIADDHNGDPIAQIQFTLKNGSILLDGQGNTLNLNIDHSAQGDGTYSSTIFSWGGLNSDNDYSVSYINRGVFQFGVGTRNIKEAFIGWTSRDSSKTTPPIGDWSNIASYEVYTRSTGTTIAAIGQKLVYHINHDSEKDKFFDKSVRFHWQSRLGGIDSYTFDGMSTEGISVKSKMYEESIYPQFDAQLGLEVDTAKFLGGKETKNTKVTYGALQSRIGGLTSDEYRSVSKSTVKAFREGQAVSKPYPREQKGMMEDLLSSPNVWIEKGWRGREVFRDNFDVIANLEADWTLFSGTEIQAASNTDNISTSDGHTTGVGCYRKGDNDVTDDSLDSLWAIAKAKKFAYNPDKIYEVEVRIKSEYISANAAHYVGLAGIASDGTTLVNTSGSNAHSSQHNITLNAYQIAADNEWEVHRGYITGLRESEGFTFPRNSANFASKAHEDVKFFAPTLILNYDLTSAGADDGVEDRKGRAFIDYIVVREYESDLPNTQGWYSTLNRNYYVPVNIKDSKTNTSDSENQSTMTINYVESKNKKTIQ